MKGLGAGTGWTSWKMVAQTQMDCSGLHLRCDPSCWACKTYFHMAMQSCSHEIALCSTIFLTFCYGFDFIINSFYTANSFTISVFENLLALMYQHWYWQVIVSSNNTILDNFIHCEYSSGVYISLNVCTYCKSGWLHVYPGILGAV